MYFLSFSTKCVFFIHTLYFSKICLLPGVILDTSTSILTLCLRYIQAKLLSYYSEYIEHKTSWLHYMKAQI